MSTLRELISNVRAELRLVTGDATINNRVVASEIRSINLMLVKQQTDKRKLFQSPNLFTVVPCIEMEEAPLGECCDFTSPCTVSKSKKRLPKIAEGIFGLLVQRVSGLDTLNNYKETTARRFANIKRLNLTTNELYFWIYDGHLYVSSEDIKRVTVVAFFEEEVPVELLYPDKDCNCKEGPSTDDLCKNPLDREFKCPGYLEQTIKDLVVKKLMETYMRVPQDATSDNKDDQTQNR